MSKSDRLVKIVRVNKAIQFVLAIGVLLAVTFGASQFQAVERESNLRLWMMDVGQGDALLFDSSDGHQVLIDGGPNNTILTRLSQAMPLTDKEIELVIVSHNHADHLAGVNSVLEHYKVNEIWISGAEYDSATYRKFAALVAEKRIKTTIVTAGTTYSVSGLSGIALFPLSEVAGTLPTNPHDASVVTFWQYGQTTVLLTGDAESEHEATMLSRGIIRRADILKIGHHGSNTSSSLAFLQAVSPKIALISVAKVNRYGHPHQTTLDNLSQLKIPVLSTGQDETVRFDITPEGYSYKTGL